MQGFSNFLGLFQVIMANPVSCFDNCSSKKPTLTIWSLPNELSSLWFCDAKRHQHHQHCLKWISKETSRQLLVKFVKKFNPISFLWKNTPYFACCWFWVWVRWCCCWILLVGLSITTFFSLPMRRRPHSTFPPTTCCRRNWRVSSHIRRPIFAAKREVSFLLLLKSRKVMRWNHHGFSPHVFSFNKNHSNHGFFHRDNTATRVPLGDGAVPLSAGGIDHTWGATIVEIALGSPQTDGKNDLCHYIRSWHKNIPTISHKISKYHESL